MDPNGTPNPTIHDVEAILTAGTLVGNPKIMVGFRPYAIVPEGMQLEPLDRLIPPERPDRIKAHPVFDDPASLSTYLNDFKDEHSIVVADVDNSKIVSVLDYHEAHNAEDVTPDGHNPRHGEHRASFVAKVSPEWATWTEKDGEPMSQVDFATFIEDNAPDIKVPDAAVLYEMALALQATSTGEFRSHKRLTDGSISFAYSDNVNATAGADGATIPKEMQVLLRPYMGCDAVALTARLRFRINGGKLSMWFDLLRAEHVQRQAFDAIIEKISAETGVEILRGVLA